MEKGKITFVRCEATAYTYFGFHNLHYLDSDGKNTISPAAACFLFFYDGEVAGFCSVINKPRGGCCEAMMFNRVVVLAQYRGKGIGGYMLNTIAAIYYNEGNKVYLMTGNELLNKYCTRHPDKWIACANNGKYRSYNFIGDKKYKKREEGIHYHYRYMGDLNSEYEDYTLPVNKMRINNRIYNINKN